MRIPERKPFEKGVCGLLCVCLEVGVGQNHVKTHAHSQSRTS